MAKYFNISSRLREFENHLILNIIQTFFFHMSQFSRCQSFRIEFKSSKNEKNVCSAHALDFRSFLIYFLLYWIRTKTENRSILQQKKKAETFQFWFFSKLCYMLVKSKMFENFFLKSLFTCHTLWKEIVFSNFFNFLKIYINFRYFHASFIAEANFPISWIVDFIFFYMNLLIFLLTNCSSKIHKSKSSLQHYLLSL